MKMSSKGFSLFALLTCSLIFAQISCSRNQQSSDSGSARLQVRLTDAPFTDAKEVWVDVRQIEVIYSDTSHPLVLNGAHPGMYNLLDFANGRDTLLADATVPPGTISQIRLILGDNNYIVNHAGDHLPLKTPSGQESGLKVQVHQPVSGGILYRLILDFDAGRSIVQAGNSGKYLLKPVLRILSLEPSGGDIQGVIEPDSFSTFVYAIQGADTIASTISGSPGGWYLFKDIPAGNYTITYLPSDTSFKLASGPATCTLGQITTLDTVFLHK
jgi:hypothetical protein